MVEYDKLVIPEGESGIGYHQKMKQFIEKMEAEAKELDCRIVKAKQVLLTQPFGTDEMGLHLLDKQVQAMSVYSDLLHQRIEYEKKRG
jgi:hypothetical protein